MFWNFASKKSSAVFRKQAGISLLQSGEARRALLTKRWKDPELFFLLFQHSHQISLHLHSFCRWIELIYQTFRKAGRLSSNNVFRPKKMNKSLHLFIFKRRNALMSRIERKYCLISTAHLAVLFDISILVDIWQNWVLWWLYTNEDTLWCLS